MKTRNDLGVFLNAHGLCGEGAEVGVENGIFARIVLDSWQGRLYHLVDSWRQRDFERFIGRTLKRLEAHQDRIIIHRCLSLAASKHFADGSLDFVYIDANHDYQSVRTDLNAWWPKLRDGGLFCGHDYLNAPWKHPCEVKRAVDEFVAPIGKTILITEEPLQAPDLLPSWYFFK